MIGKGFMEVLLGVNIKGSLEFDLWLNEKILQLLMDRKVEKKLSHQFL